MKLSDNFTLEELTRSDTAIKLKIKNVPDPNQIKYLTKLAKEVLQPLRNHIGRPIRVTSGFRGKDLNEAVGGSKKSQHGSGQAADIVVGGMTAYSVAQRIIELDLPYDQLIYESVGASKWVHVSVSDNPRKQVLSYDGKKYWPGLLNV